VPDKINDLSATVPGGSPSLGGARAPAVAPAAAPAAGTATGAAPAASDVHITGTASSLATLETTLRDAPAVDAARVAAVRSAIDENRYTVDPGHIAGELLQMEHALAQLHGTRAATAADPQAAPDES
jgi:negative regulator of flagellin synthesis FlgM